MKFSIIPTTYLICLSLLLTPLTFFVIFQVFKFNKTIFALKNYEITESHTIIDPEENYYIANLYIQHQMWHIALTRFENEIYQGKSSSNLRKAECYNAIGFILHKLGYYTLAKKYYLKSSSVEPQYIYPKKNLLSLP